MARWPSKIQPNSVNAKILSALDWYPTIGFLAGYSSKPGLAYDGVNIAAALITDAESPRTTFFFHSTSDVDCQGATDPEPAPLDASAAVPHGNCSWTEGLGYDNAFAEIKDVASQEECCRLW